LQSLRQAQSEALESKRLEYEKEKIRAEIEARAQQERINEEIAIRKLQTQSKLDTERMVEGIKSVSLQVTAIVRDVFSRPRQLAILAGIFLALLVSYFLIRECSALVRQFVQTRIGKPSLVRETSFHWSLLPQWVHDLSISSLFSSSSSSSNDRNSALTASLQQLEAEFADVILSDEDKTRVLNLALATRNTRRSGAPYRHVLLHGPPGTGKTLIARRLAQSSGMDYAILSGGDVAPLGEDAVSQLHALFRWASRSRRGLLVFIDEAEAFLSSRANNGSNNAEGASSDAHIRNSLNALLYQTGTPSRSFMMVLATNRPEDLDSAILDRVDVSLHVSLPQEQQRRQLIQLYMNIHLRSPAAVSLQASRSAWWRRLVAAAAGGGRDVKVVHEDCFLETHLANMAKITAGFSGREISKMMISAQYAMFLAVNQTLTWPILKHTVELKIEEHRVKGSGFKVCRIHEDAVDGVEATAVAIKTLASTSTVKNPTSAKKTPRK
jgi:ATPase family AAA domain-containing protein 3A/B